MTEATPAPALGDMSDEDKQDLVANIAEQIANRDHELHFALQAVLGIKDDADQNSIGLTLVTPGGTISGLGVTKAVWGERHYSGFPDGLAPMVAEGREVLAEMQERFAATRVELEVPDPPRRYIHLVDATIRNGGYPVSVPYMRVYVKDVVAWSVHALGGYQE